MGTYTSINVAQLLISGYYVIGDRWSDELERVLFEACGRIQTLCRSFLDDTKDSSVISPAFLEPVRLKRSKPNEKIGLIFKLSMDGIHTVSGIRENSPASRCNKLSIMDEIVQIDYTCVTNWTLENILNKFKLANPNEVCLTLRKRPRNMTLHYHLRRMKVMMPPAHDQLKKEQNSRRVRKGTVDSSKGHPVVTTIAAASGAVSPKKPIAEQTNPRQSFLAPDARKPTETLGVTPIRLGSRKDSLRRRSLSANSVQHVEDMKLFNVNKTSTPTQPPAKRDEVLQSVSSNDPSTSSGALSSDQDSSVFQTSTVQPHQQEAHERHSVIDRRVSIKDLGETEISGTLQRKRGNEWIPCHCVIKNALFYVFASSAAEKADLVIGLKSVDVEIADKQDNYKFVFRMQTTNQQKKFLFAAGDRTDLGHWVNNLHTAKVLLRNKKISATTRQLLVTEMEIDEAVGDADKNGKRHNSCENFSETDEEDEGDAESSKNGANTECNELEKSLRLLRSSFLGGASAGASPFSRSSTIDEGSNRLESRSISAAKLSGSYLNFSDKLESNLEACSQEKDTRLNQSTDAVPVKASSFDSNNSGDKEPYAESYLITESSQSMKLVLAPDAIEERLEKVWEEPSTELDRLQSKKRALERKLQAKLIELTKVEELITTGEKDPSQLVFSHVYREQAPAVTWHTTEEEDQSAIDTEL